MKSKTWNHINEIIHPRFLLEANQKTLWPGELKIVFSGKAIYFLSLTHKNQFLTYLPSIDFQAVFCNRLFDFLTKFTYGSQYPACTPPLFVQLWLPHLGGGVWVIETHVIIFHENQDLRCQKSFYNRFGD